MLTLAYIGFCVFGSAYILFSIVTGHLDAGDIGGHGSEHGPSEPFGVGGQGHGAVMASAAAPAEFHFPFFSPLAFSTLLACVGAYGLMGLYGLDLSPRASLAVAIPLALATAYLVTYVGWRLMSSSRGTSSLRLDAACGATAEVITPIAPGGVGEIAVLVGGQRLTGPAREEQGREVARSDRPVVRAVVGATFIVSRER